MSTVDVRPTTTRVHRAWWVLVACCLMFGGIVGVIGNSAGIYLKPVSEELGVSLAALNGYMTVVALVMTATLPIAGWVLPRFKVQVVLAVALTLGTGTYAASALFTSLTHWYIAAVALGISFGFLLYVPIPLLVNNWFRRRNGLAIGLTAAFASLVAAFVNPIGGALIDSIGWRETRAIMGGIGFLMSVPAVLLLIRYSPEQVGLKPYGAEAEEEAEASGAGSATAPVSTFSLRQAVRMPQFWMVMVLAGLFALGASMLQQTPSHASAVGIASATGAAGVSAIMIGGIVGKLGLGWLHDRVGVVATTMVSTALGVAGAATVITSGDQVTGFLAGCFIFGGAYAGLVVVPPLTVRHFFGIADYSRIYSLVTFSLGAFSALAPILYASIYDRTGSFNGAWVVAAGSYVLIAVLMLVVNAISRRRT
ncbi:MFS transporter [Actinotalea sp. M2MS4P-6]|uniref:MFS transporter n=1 Tax=Actinotalea sp. M2MS4P-6 TaxID=2983762 RepID=UPI0021E44EBB|nr:MFS transporter [Actinotalea sp. M2MS4P-6]MCV2394278.1 MFS transporter [Actinotalea sp. M2MS4P-6]